MRKLLKSASAVAALLSLAACSAASDLAAVSGGGLSDLLTPDYLKAADKATYTPEQIAELFGGKVPESLKKQQ
jgi:hypothetical protein